MNDELIYDWNEVVRRHPPFGAVEFFDGQGRRIGRLGSGAGKPQAEPARAEQGTPD
jgi:hypothetical protein